MPDALQTEIAARIARGEERLSVAALGERYAALGYQLDRSLDCRALARYVSGPDAGRSYPACTTGVREADTGLSAFNSAARRDDRFRQMQALRQEAFAVSRGAILEV